MSPWLFNMYMDGVIREVDVRVQGRGVKLIGHGGYVWRVNQLLYADDTVLIGESKEELQRLLNEFDNVCERRKLKVNVGKSKVMVCGKNEREESLSLSLKGEVLEEVESFKYLGSIVGKNGGAVEDVISRVNEGAKVSGAMSRLWKVRSVGVNVKKMMYERIVVPTVLYGAETWGLNVREKRRLDVMEMKCLRSMCGVTVRDRIRNEEIRRRVGVQINMSGRVERCVLRWFGHVERMNDERMAKRVYVSGVDGRRGRGRPNRVWMDGVKEALNKRGWTLEQAKTTVHDRVEWRRMVNGA